MRKLYVFFSTVLIVISSLFIDQLSKIDAEKNLMLYQHEDNLKIYRGKRVELVYFGKKPDEINDKDFYFSINLNYIRNQGAAWGFLSDMHDNIRIPFFYIVTVIAIIFIIIHLYKTPLKYALVRFGFIMILSGALGNFTDRIIRGYVIDFIDVEWNINGWFYNFPTFNWADSCISIGVFFWIIDMIFFEKKKRV
jgi:lipoprotein signal peptidase